MRRLLLATAGLALLLPAAVSQTSWAQTAPAPGALAQAVPVPDAGVAPAPRPVPAGQPGPMGGPGMPPPPPGGPRGPGMMPPPPPPLSRAAHFHLQRGDAVVDVKCADEDTTKACADVVATVLDKLAALPPAARN